MNFLLEKGDWKKLEKNNVTIVLNAFYAEKKYILLIFQNTTQIVKNKLFLE